jgi:ribosomal protein L10
MKTKAQKKESIDALASVLPKASITLFTTFARAKEQGLSVAKMQELKRALRAKGGKYLVAKKALESKKISIAALFSAKHFMQACVEMKLGIRFAAQ